MSKKVINAADCICIMGDNLESGAVGFVGSRQGVINLSRGAVRQVPRVKRRKAPRKGQGKKGGNSVGLGSSVRLMRRQDLYTITSSGSLRSDVGPVGQSDCRQVDRTRHARNLFLPFFSRRGELRP